MLNTQKTSFSILIIYFVLSFPASLVDAQTGPPAYVKTPEPIHEWGGEYLSMFETDGSEFVFKNDNGSSIVMKVEQVESDTGYRGAFSGDVNLIFTKRNDVVRKKTIMLPINATFPVDLFGYNNDIFYSRLSAKNWICLQCDTLVHCTYGWLLAYLPTDKLAYPKWQSVDYGGTFWINPFQVDVLESEQIDGVTTDCVKFKIKYGRNFNYGQSQYEFENELHEWWSPTKGLIAFEMPDGKVYIRSEP